MRRLVRFPACSVGFGRTPAAARPAPMSEADLLAKSDLVALVRIKSVTCTGVSKDERTGEALPSYSANVELIEVIKGDAVKGNTSTSFSTSSRGACSARGPFITIPARWCGRTSSAGRRLHHDVVERPRRAGEQDRHHHAADQARRGRRDKADPHRASL